MNTYNEKQKLGLEFLNDLYQNSWNNPEFKERLIKNPSITIQETGYDVSPNVRFAVEDQSDSSTVYLNIPAKKDLETLELSDEQLDMVAGGDVIVACFIIGAVCTIACGAGIALGKAVNTPHR